VIQRALRRTALRDGTIDRLVARYGVEALMRGLRRLDSERFRFTPRTCRCFHGNLSVR
jgi:hypothetical protein